MMMESLVTGRHSARAAKQAFSPAAVDESTAAPTTTTASPRILATPPPIVRTRLLSATEYFTPAFYDTLALFLHKHGVRYTNISLLGRGTSPDEAQRCPAVVVKVLGDAEVVEHVRLLFVADEALVRMVPKEVKVVEFLGIV